MKKYILALLLACTCAIPLVSSAAIHQCPVNKDQAIQEGWDNLFGPIPEGTYQFNAAFIHLNNLISCRYNSDLVLSAMRSAKPAYPQNWNEVGPGAGQYCDTSLSACAFSY